MNEKEITALSMAVVMAFGLTACGGSGSGNAGTTTAALAVLRQQTAAALEKLTRSNCITIWLRILPSMKVL